jgi:nucleoside-diphosphate-sugar epimerase
MAFETAATTFVTGAAGFIGTELVKELTGRGHHVLGLVGSADEALRLRHVGATAVMGDLLVPGRWQDEAGADWVFHLPPHQSSPWHLMQARTDAVASARLLMDAHLLDAIAAGPTRRVIYVTDTRCYGATGSRPITEDEVLSPHSPDGCLTPALDRLEGYAVSGLPIVTALPGWVYGNAAWFRQRVIEPIIAGRRVLQFGDPGPWVSPIHVRDCARALVHLAEHGAIGRRYFVVNSDAVRMSDFAATFARLANRPLRVWRMPAAAARFVGNSRMSGNGLSDAVFSNVRLRGTGFRFLYPTLEQGLQQVVGAFNDE